MADLQLLTPTSEPPESPIDGLEHLLTTEQLCAWTGYSRKTVYTYRTRSADPLPTVGPAGALQRYLPSDVIAWMRREAARVVAASDR
jgi:predicted DNA-binding transcriptional regulator AlpA